VSHVSSFLNESCEELWAVVPAAGRGTRLPSAYPKQYLELKGRCLLQRAVDTLTGLPNIKGVVVSLSKDDNLWPELPASQHELVMTTTGGASRAESVIAGLKMVNERSTSDKAMVLVHDAARAMTAADDILRLIDRVCRSPEQGGLLATKVQDTLKRASSATNLNQQSNNLKQHATVGETISRAELWQAQTPQMFQANVLLECLLENQQAIEAGDITDEACAMERAGYSPALVEALQPNFKITHSRDYDMALALIELRENNQAQSIATNQSTPGSTSKSK